MHEIKRSKSAGFSLIELLVALGLSGLLVTGVVKIMGSFLKSHKHIDLKDERLSVKQAIKYSTDCKAASYPNICADGQLLDIPGKGATTLIAKDSSSTMRGWTLRAICRAPNRVEVQAAKIKGDGSFAEDPLSKQAFDWQHNAAILIAAGTLCPSPQGAPAENPIIKFGTNCYIVSGVQAAQCFSASIEPPDCDAGFVSTGVGKDDFGSNTDFPLVLGWRKLRYCKPN